MSNSEVDMSTNYFYDDVSSSEDSNTCMGQNGKQTQEEEVTQPCEIQNNEKPKDKGCYQRRPKQKKKIPDEAQQYIGLLICKEYNGVSYLGSVRNYDAGTKWFRVEYYDGGSEDMRAGDVRKCIASNEQVSQALGLDLTDTATAAGKQKKPASGEGTSTRRTKKRRRNKASYVPLAYRETKKDAYYYY